MHAKTSKKKIFLYMIVSIFLTGFLIPQNLKMPVDGATKSSYNQQSFWYYPWGKSGTHKGVDIFAKEGTAIKSATNGMVVFTGQLGLGGNVIVVLGPKWRFHYYAHLQKINTKKFSFVSTDKIIATVGTSGNAKGKPPHLHYAITTLIPYVWRMDKSPQGTKKMFYLNPIAYLNK